MRMKFLAGAAGLAATLAVGTAAFAAAPVVAAKADRPAAVGVEPVHDHYYHRHHYRPHWGWYRPWYGPYYYPPAVVYRPAPYYYAPYYYTAPYYAPSYYYVVP